MAPPAQSPVVQRVGTALAIVCGGIEIDRRRWRVRVSADLAPVVFSHGRAGGELTEAAAAALRFELGAAGDSAWRATLDLDSTLVGVVVEPSSKRLRLGSPGFATERFICRVDPAAASLAYTAHAAAWEAASARARPRDIERSAAARGLAALHATPAPGALAPVLRRTAQLAEELAAHVDAYRPPLLERLSGIGLGLQADYALVRIHALRFVALLPSLDHDDEGHEIRRRLLEMLRRIAEDSTRARRLGHRGAQGPLPAWMEGACRIASVVGARISAHLLARITRWSVRKLAGIFIAGETIEEAREALEELEATGRTATLDQLGELVISEVEADGYCDRVLELIRGTASRCGRARTAADIPVGHVSVKVSALCAHYDPDDAEGTWEQVGERLLRIFRAARQGGVFIHLDAEHYAVRELTFRMLVRALRSDSGLWSWPDVGIVVQAYLVDAADHLAELLALCRGRGVRMPIRLVKGAYWDEETTEASAHGWDAPHFLSKSETDACFQQLCLAVLAAGDVAQLCIGSHNLRDHCFARAARELLHPDAPPIEHQTLHRTYEALSTGMAKMGWAVRNYIPVGSLLVGMAYLVRRVMENSSQAGVLAMARRGVDLTATLTTPAEALLEEDRGGLRPIRPTTVRRSCEDFVNVAPARLYLPAHRAAFDAALGRAGARLVELSDRPHRSGAAVLVHSPSDDRLIGSIRFARPEDVPGAVCAARVGGAAWAAQPVQRRAAILVRGAELMRVRRPDLAALVCREAGKARAEALADVDEAIDFMGFYAREALRRERADPCLRARGVVAVVAPWNFPIAIPCGMTTAALAAGNAAILKSAEQTPLVAEALIDLLHEAGVPTDVAIHLPGDGPGIGAALTADPRIAGCVFTGSKAVGTSLYRRLAARLGPAEDRRAGTLVITEMGGKNAVIVTAGADLDEAVQGCIYAAYGHAGQKCSATSRILVDRRVVAFFARRFAGAVSDLQVGPATAPGTRVNPVISAQDAGRLRDAARRAARECARHGGRVLADRSADFEGAPGHLVGPAVFLLPPAAAEDPASVTRNELFGPIVVITPYDDLDQAVSLFNGTEYALTGGIYSQSLDEIEALVGRLRCGNLYVNRPNTAARVAIEPFGGFRISGTGPKAGGSRYLDAFYRPRGCPSSARPTWPDGAGTPERRLPGADPRDTLAAAAPSWPGPREIPAAVAHLSLARLDRGLHSASVDLDHRSAAALLAATGALLRHRTRLADEPRPTRRIAGQETGDHRDLPRGPALLLAAADHATEHLCTHLVAALAAGSPVLVLATGPSVRAWRRVIATAHAADVPQDAVQLWEAPTLADAIGLLTTADLATVACDGLASDWRELLDPIVQSASLHLPALHDSAGGPGLEELDALWECHTVVRTVTVNTMRHGAPLALD